MIFAHAFVGLIIAYFITPIALKGYGNVKLWRLNKKILIWIIAIISSVFPDIDILYVTLVDITIKHRKLLTHSIIPYTIALILTLTIIRAKKLDKYFIYITITAYIGILFHLIADLYIAPVYMLSPFLKTEFLWKPFPLDHTAGFKEYFFSPYMFTELIIMITGTILLIKSFINKKKDLIMLLSLLGIIMTSATIALIPFIYSFN